MVRQRAELKRISFFHEPSLQKKTDLTPKRTLLVPLYKLNRNIFLRTKKMINLAESRYGLHAMDYNCR